jgi:hypothetical protein
MANQKVEIKEQKLRIKNEGEGKGRLGENVLRPGTMFGRFVFPALTAYNIPLLFLSLSLFLSLGAITRG